MRGVVVSLVVVVALAIGAASMGGAAAASHRVAKGVSLDATSPSWSPDGKQIAFAYVSASSHRYRIVRTSSGQGGAVHSVLTAKGSCCEEVQWATKGRILVDPHGGLESLRVRGGKPSRVAFLSCGTDRNPWGCSTAGWILSPGDRYAAVATTPDPSDPHSTFGIGLAKLSAERDPAVLTTALDSEENAFVIDIALAFTPDARQLVFSRIPTDGFGNEGTPALMAIRVAGGEPVPLAQSEIRGGYLVPSDAAQVQWSPDGKWVAYDEYDSAADVQRLEVVPTSGDDTPRELTSCSAGTQFGFSWSPTAQLIAYACDTGFGASGQLVTERPDGTDSTDLLQHRHLGYVQNSLTGGPQWSPEGSRLVFAATGTGGVDHVWTVRADGSLLTRVG